MLRIYNLNTNCRRVSSLYLIPLGLRRNERKAFFLLSRAKSPSGEDAQLTNK